MIKLFLLLIIIFLFLLQSSATLAETGTVPKVVAWYENAAIMGPLIGLFGSVLVLLINRWWEKRRKEVEDEKEDDDTHNTLFSKLTELNAEERKDLRNLILSVHDKEINFFKTQLEERNRFHNEQMTAKDLQIYAISESEKQARLRSHNFINEVERIKAHVMLLQILLAQANIEIPAFTFTQYTELMLTNLEDEKMRSSVEKLKENLIKNATKRLSSGQDVHPLEGDESKPE